VQFEEEIHCMIGNPYYGSLVHILNLQSIMHFLISLVIILRLLFSRKGRAGLHVGWKARAPRKWNSPPRIL